MPGDALIDVRSLQRRFGSRLVPSGLTMIVRPGECVGLAGANGSGKSTALRLLGGLLAADVGEGHVLGRRLERLGAETRRQIGFLPQRAALHARLPVIDSLRFRAAVAGCDRPMEQARRACAALGITRRAREPLANFSGGWVRRIEIAATLLHEPLLALLDEPTSGIDEAAKAAIWAALHEHRKQGQAIVFSSHDAAELQYADRVIQLRTEELV
jgi:ABC-2 type transport system ATP-binding protein